MSLGNAGGQIPYNKSSLIRGKQMGVTAVGFEYEKFYFPVGELHVRIKAIHSIPPSPLGAVLSFERNDDIIEVLLLADALRRMGRQLEDLHLPYIPYSRQDRVAEPGDTFSLSVFARMVNSIRARRVTVVDPHSDVGPALINNCVIIPQHEVFAPRLKEMDDFWLVAPDAGATKKIYRLASLVKTLGVVECSKLRDTKTGKITGVKVNADNLGGKAAVVVDDICDGGATFVLLAEALAKAGAGALHLYVTHGFFTKGISVFDGIYKHIVTSKGVIR